VGGSEVVAASIASCKILELQLDQIAGFRVPVKGNCTYPDFRLICAQSFNVRRLLVVLCGL
jgi:hypothetical protein